MTTAPPNTPRLRAMGWTRAENDISHAGHSRYLCQRLHTWLCMSADKLDHPLVSWYLSPCVDELVDYALTERALRALQEQLSLVFEPGQVFDDGSEGEGHVSQDKTAAAACVDNGGGVEDVALMTNAVAVESFLETNSKEAEVGLLADKLRDSCQHADGKLQPDTGVDENICLNTQPTSKPVKGPISTESTVSVPCVLQLSRTRRVSTGEVFGLNV